MSVQDRKQSRSVAKSAVTRAKSDIENLLAQGKSDGLGDLKSKLEEKVAAFEEAHLEYVSLLQEPSDIDSEKSYHDDVVTGARALLDKMNPSRQNVDDVKRLKLERKILREQFELEEMERKLQQKRQLLDLQKRLRQLNADISDDEADGDVASGAVNKSDNVSNDEADGDVASGAANKSDNVSNDSSVMLQQQKQLIDLLAAPRLEIPTFDGAPLAYFPFIRAFKDNVERVVPDHSARLTRLLQYCTGPAKRLIQCCAMMPSSEGYRRALELLKDRFGNEFTVCTSFVERVTSGQPIRERDLQEYSDDLRNGYEMLKAMDCLGEMNVQSNLGKIVYRLPVYVQNRWRREASKIKRESKRLPCFNDVVKLVEEAADEANDPVFGNCSKTPIPDRQMQPQSKPRLQRATTFSTTASPRKLMCYNCEENHSIYTCDNFKRMTPVERKRVVLQKKLCTNCLRGNHEVGSCQSEQTCRVCNERHHTVLHQDPTVAQNSYIGEEFQGGGASRIALPVVAVKVKAPGTERVTETYALLDSGSTNSFVSTSLMRKLGVRGQPQDVILNTLEKSGSSSKTLTCALTVSDIYGTHHVNLPTVFARPALPIREDNIATVDDLKAWPHLQGINLVSANASEVELLIGQDSPECLTPQTVIPGRRTEPYAIRTCLGWALCGPVARGVLSEVRTTSAFISLEEQVERFWKIDSSDLYSAKSGISAEDKKVIAFWNDNVKRDGIRYELPIPFSNRQGLQDNKDMATARLNSLERKLRKNADIHLQYTEEMKELLECNYAEEVSDDHGKPDKVWYLPHHPVTNPNKPRIRIVFDCAARFRGLSLNDCVFQGPDLTNKLTGVLLRFRRGAVAFMADIKTMFYQVKVPPSDRDVLRFLWWPNGNLDQPPKTYRMTVHLFGGCWSPSCCTYALQRSMEDNDASEFVKTVMLKSFYVDDCLCATQDVDSAKKVAEELRSVTAKSGFHLTKWTSNSREFIDSVSLEERAPNARDLNFDALPVERALGVIWNTENDTFSYNIKQLAKPATKRGILSVLSSVYDPLGLVSPFVLNARQIVQELFRRNIGWDDSIPDDILQQWRAWSQQVKSLEDFIIPRHAFPTKPDAPVELHYFCDASEKAYGVAVYVRNPRTENNRSCNTQLLMAKSRLAPLKEMTVPRLELSAANLAARMDEQLREELNISGNSSFFWTDSTIVLGYLKNESKRYKTFVNNRVMQIRELTNVDRWNHVPTHLNPADDCSRGMRADDLLQSRRWLYGPAFLERTNSEWPISDELFTVEDRDPEIKSDLVNLHANVQVDMKPIDQLIAALSTWTRVKRAVSWLGLIRDVLLKKRNVRNHLKVPDIKKAENVIIQHVQKSFPQDKRTKKILASLNSATDKDGVMRARGRIARAPIPEHSRSPIIMPKSRAAELIVREIHQNAGHVGQEFTLSLVMEKYWIIGARKIIKGVIKDCVSCRKISRAPLQQQMADLPAERVTPGSHAFASVGCDYFGPFMVKRGRGSEKRYGCLFTCLATRAIHIEIAHSLDADAFINCLQRFIARRGKPQVIWSDNGTNFVGAERELREELLRLQGTDLETGLANKEISWKFNPPAASHMGGVWERQIRSIRKILAGLCHQQILTDDALATLMCNVEAILNNRPLTVVSTDVSDPEPLTPNHLLMLRPADALPGTFVDKDLYCRQRWRQVQYLAGIFWRRWTREYLAQLQKRSKWLWASKDPSVGDVVLVIDDKAPRNTWPLGRVLETYPGNDGRVRSVKLKVKGAELVRPIVKICHLERQKEATDAAFRG